MRRIRAWLRRIFRPLPCRMGFHAWTGKRGEDEEGMQRYFWTCDACGMLWKSSDWKGHA